MKKLIGNAAFLATLLTAAPTQAKINQLIGTGFTYGIFPIKPSFSNLLSYLIDQNVSLTCPLQVEHEFGQLILGWNLQLTCRPWAYMMTATGLFFGGQITKSETTICYMKGGVNYVFLVTKSKKKFHHAINPFVEFSWRQNNKSIIHALEIGAIIWMDEVIEEKNHPLTLPFTKKQCTPQIKYKIMWKVKDVYVTLTP